MIWFMVWMCSIAVAAILADKQGRSVGLTILAGFLIGIFAPIIYLALGEKKA